MRPGGWLSGQCRCPPVPCPLPGTSPHAGWCSLGGRGEEGNSNSLRPRLPRLSANLTPRSCSADQPQTELPGLTFSYNCLSCKLSWKSQANNKHEARPSLLLAPAELLSKTDGSFRGKLHSLQGQLSCQDTDRGPKTAPVPGAKHKPYGLSKASFPQLCFERFKQSIDPGVSPIWLVKPFCAG